jgi:hypothetical protein
METSKSLQTEFSAVALLVVGQSFEGLTDVQERGILELPTGIVNNNSNNNHDVQELQNTAILGTAHILREVLT